MVAWIQMIFLSEHHRNRFGRGSDISRRQSLCMMTPLTSAWSVLIKSKWLLGPISILLEDGSILFGKQVGDLISGSSNWWVWIPQRTAQRLGEVVVFLSRQHHIIDPTHLSQETVHIEPQRLWMQTRLVKEDNITKYFQKSKAILATNWKLTAPTFAKDLHPCPLLPPPTYMCLLDLNTIPVMARLL